MGNYIIGYLFDVNDEDSSFSSSYQSSDISIIDSSDISRSDSSKKPPSKSKSSSPSIIDSSNNSNFPSSDNSSAIGDSVNMNFPYFYLNDSRETYTWAAPYNPEWTQTPGKPQSYPPANAFSWVPEPGIPWSENVTALEKPISGYAGLSYTYISNSLSEIGLKAVIGLVIDGSGFIEEPMRTEYVYSVTIDINSGETIDINNGITSTNETFINHFQSKATTDGLYIYQTYDLKYGQIRFEDAINVAILYNTDGSINKVYWQLNMDKLSITKNKPESPDGDWYQQVLDGYPYDDQAGLAIGADETYSITTQPTAPYWDAYNGTNWNEYRVVGDW